MRRVIRMRNDRPSYNRKTYELVSGIRDHFHLQNSKVYKYVITITEGGEYTFRDSFGSQYSVLYQREKRIGILCKWSFRRVFFNPDPNKKYDITVEKVKIKKKK